MLVSTIQIRPRKTYTYAKYQKFSYEEAGTYNSTTSTFEYTGQFYRTWVYKLGFSLIFSVSLYYAYAYAHAKFQKLNFRFGYIFYLFLLNGLFQTKKKVWLTLRLRQNSYSIVSVRNFEKISWLLLKKNYSVKILEILPVMMDRTMVPKRIDRLLHGHQRTVIGLYQDTGPKVPVELGNYSMEP